MKIMAISFSLIIILSAISSSLNTDSIEKVHLNAKIDKEKQNYLSFEYRQVKYFFYLFILFAAILLYLVFRKYSLNLKIV